MPQKPTLIIEAPMFDGFRVLGFGLFRSAWGYVLRFGCGFVVGGDSLFAQLHFVGFGLFGAYLDP